MRKFRLINRPIPEITDRERMALSEGAKLIPLTRGKWAIVDACDFDELDRWHWSISRSKRADYAQRSSEINGVTRHIYMHRVIISPGTLSVDHKNHDTLDNRGANLRSCSGSQNNGNAKKHRSCSSKFKGVRLDRRNGKWCASIGFEVNKRKWLGYFHREIDAAAAYNDAAATRFGEFAYLNEIGGQS